MTEPTSDQLLAFYGDDFTGSTDAMDALSRAGIDTVLFLEPPDPAALEGDGEFADVQAFGVAGTSRSMTPPEMTDELTPVFRELADLDVPLVHYKICSTFDSSPDVGSIGHVVDIAADAFETDSIPLVPAAPPLGRYVVFGNMFARDEDGVYRLDRHPTMSEHPVTPMDESDLRRHLGEQTDRSMALVDVLALRDGRETASEQLESARDDAEIVFFDALDDDDLRTVGGALWDAYAEGIDVEIESPAFAVGSSGLEYALADHWEREDVLAATPDFEPLPPVDRLLVMSGSASPLTSSQIDAAIEHGFVGIRVDTRALVDPDEVNEEYRRVRNEALEAFRRGDSAVLYTARGPDDDAIDETTEYASDRPEAPSNVGRYIGTRQGELLGELVTEADLDRVCVAGGDTCGAVASQLDIYALESRFPLDPGSPLCRTRARTESIDGLEIALKGGQLGARDYFVRAMEGANEW
ncbi:four-carbon acid sugar kinase family protein [Halomontanus rarus]|uniref:four-carbon acid sugar kinase family protein n=1 Tax=Halomontanus rarus TaxID=3034020 RepID=UPI001A9A024A